MPVQRCRGEHDEEYDAWVVGAGLEKKLGSIAIRGELRYADHDSSTRTVPFDDVAVTVPMNSHRVESVWEPG